MVNRIETPSSEIIKTGHHQRHDLKPETHFVNELNGVENRAEAAALATHGFEQAELLQPQGALQAAGAETKVVSLEKGKIKGWNEKLGPGSARGMVLRSL